MKYNSFIKIFILHIYIFLIFFSNYSSSQYFETGYPYINNIPPSEYGYESQNFSIVQDNLGILFIANLNGVIEYDGTSWNLIKVPGAYSLAAGTDGIIYVGGYNEFGYLNRNIYGCIQYFSFIHELDTRYSGFGTVKEALACTNEIFFSTQTKLFRWNFKNVECIDSADNYLKIFKADNILYEYKSGIGLLEYAGYNFTMVIEGDFFSKKKIIEILPFNNSTLLVSTFRQAQCNAGSTHSNTGKNLLIKTESEKGFYLYCSDSIIPFNTKADDFFEENKISCATILSGTYYAFGTNRCGLIIINNKGEILYNINNATGLYDDDIRDIYIDNSFNMWLATNNGISRVEVPDAFSYFDRTSGLSGGAKEIIRHNGILYVATTQGLFYLDRQKELLASCRPSLRFLPVKGIDSDGNTFFSTCSKLFLATDNGLYKISDSTSALIIDGLHEIVIESEKYPGHLYNGRSDGLAVLKYENGSLSEDCKIKNINSHIRTIVEEDNGTLWLGTDYEGVYMVDLSSEWNTEPDMFHFQKGYGLPVDYEWIDVYKTSGGILFSTAKGVFRFNKQIKRFYQDTLLGIYFSDSKQWLFPVVEDKNKNLWFTSGQTDCYSKQTIMALFQGEGKKYRIIRSPFIKIRNYTIEDIYPDTNDIVWLASFDKVLRYDNKMMNSAYPAFHTILKKVVVGKDSLLPVHTYTYEKNKIIAGQIDSLIPVLPYRLNSFFFEFAAPSYQSEKQVVYSYILEGFNKNWSEWALLNKKEYTNLPEGAYTFKVKARDIFGNESAETAFSFSVQPPYYRTWWAYLAYLLILGSFVYMVIRWRNLLFEKERHKLEKMIIERTDEIVRQKERAEQLVANILPKETAEELKSAGRSARKKYKMVTVLFSDIHGFSNISDRANPDEILDELDKYFYHFDEVVERFHIEKVRTVGDTYMCAGGIPVKNRTNPIDVIMA
ncbi:MAG: hypothetical protein HY738_04295, partial [Bacteroidia bacterium]|nr:hypothetical protein [Bacteroidia bacterium]